MDKTTEKLIDSIFKEDKEEALDIVNNATVEVNKKNLDAMMISFMLLGKTMDLVEGMRYCNLNVVTERLKKLEELKERFKKLMFHINLKGDNNE